VVVSVTLSRIGLLGPVEAWASDGRRVDVGTRRQQAVLAVLALRANTPVTAESLLEAVWGSEHPASAVQLVQTYVHRLRRAIQAGGLRSGQEGSIRTVDHGYVLSLPPAAIDVVGFERLVGRAGRARASGQLAGARDLLDEALRMWRGEPFAGLPGPLLDRERQRLVERRGGVRQDLLELELRLGRHREAVAELTGMVAESPFQERLVELLMLALYRSGRRSEALALYGRTRRLLDDELGVPPGPGLRRLHLQILRSEDAPDEVLSSGSPRTWPAPAQLPRDTDAFTGREEETAILLGMLSRPAGTPVAVVYGRPGIGKTTLTVHVAHRARRAFPAGQLYLDLGGSSSSPVDPNDAVDYVLRSVGLSPAELPEAFLERAALLRTWLAGRRMLLVLDDAASAPQVRPLLPGGPGPAVLITGRRPLTDLDGIQHVRLDSLNETDGLRMLRAVLGDQRVDSDPAAARDILTACAGLPLAIRIAAGKLAEAPHWPLQQLATVLSDEDRRLDALTSPDRAVRASIARSVDLLPPRQRTAFMLLSLLDPAPLDIAGAAALLDTDQTTAAQIIDALVVSQLVDVQLVDIASHAPAGQLPIHFHDLVRLYAREQALSHLDRAAAQAATARLIDLDLTRMDHARCLSIR
jgi:DNA-binding SARP family transcriptional activator